MFFGTRPGWIEVIAGVMFSGKSEELIRRVRRAVIARKKVQVFKSHLDARYAGLYSVATHDGLTVEADDIERLVPERLDGVATVRRQPRRARAAHRRRCGAVHPRVAGR